MVKINRCLALWTCEPCRKPLRRVPRTLPGGLRQIPVREGRRNIAVTWTGFQNQNVAGWQNFTLVCLLYVTSPQKSTSGLKFVCCTIYLCTTTVVQYSRVLEAWQICNTILWYFRFVACQPKSIKSTFLHLMASFWESKYPWKYLQHSIAWLFPNF